MSWRLEDDSLMVGKVALNLSVGLKCRKVLVDNFQTSLCRWATVHSLLYLSNWLTTIPRQSTKLLDGICNEKILKFRRSKNHLKFNFRSSNCYSNESLERLNLSSEDVQSDKEKDIKEEDELDEDSIDEVVIQKEVKWLTLQYFWSSEMKPMRAVECPGSLVALCWKLVAKSAKATSAGRYCNVNESHAKISNWCKSWSGILFSGNKFNPKWEAAARQTLNISLNMVKGVMGCSGPAPGFISNLEAKIARILKRSDGEHLDCEMLTKSRGSGTTIRLSLPCSCCNFWCCIQAKWKAATAMHDKCLGCAFILARNRSMLEMALKNTSDGKSYQT